MDALTAVFVLLGSALLLAVMLGACAGRQYVRRCEAVTRDCSALLDTCRARESVYEFGRLLQKVSRETCDAEVERLVRGCGR